MESHRSPGFNDHEENREEFRLSTLAPPLHNKWLANLIRMLQNVVIASEQSADIWK